MCARCAVRRCRRDINRATPAWIAAAYGRTDVVRVLAELGANLETPGSGDATPAYIASQNGHPEVVRVLAELGANLETPGIGEVTPAAAAAGEGHAEVLRVLRELGVNLETPDFDGTTPAFRAAQGGHAEAINELAKTDPDLVNRQDAFLEDTVDEEFPMRLLAVAVNLGHPEAAKSLILLCAPVTEDDLKERYLAAQGLYPAVAHEVRTELHNWAATHLKQHRDFQSTFLFGCSAHAGIALSMLGGGGCMEQTRKRIGAFVGVAVGAKLRIFRELAHTINSVEWQDIDRQDTDLW